MQLRKNLLLVFLSLFVFSFATLVSANQVTWNGGGEITVDGFGVAPANAKSQAQAMMMARRAAIVDAYRNIGEMAQGVLVDSETSVRDMMVESDVVKTKMSAVVKGAVIVSEGATPEGGYKVTMKIPLFGVNSVASAVLPQNTTPAPFAQPSAPVPTELPPTMSIPAPSSGSTQTPSGAFANGYTGIIVDCRGLGIIPVMSPVIYDSNNRPIYGYRNLDYDKVIQLGMADYESDINKYRRAGSNPLIVKALAVQGHHNGNPVISPSDADFILAENQKSYFLENLAVVFVI